MRRIALLRSFLVVTAVFTGLVIAGSMFLFSGSAVACDVLSDAETGPRIDCAFGVAATPREVWQALTLTDEPRPYYFDAVLEAELHVGGRWRFLTDDRRRLLAGGRVVTIEPPRRFTQTFQAADLDDPESRIRVEIEPAANGCRVRLIHDDFATESATYRRFQRAHPLALSALKAFLETGRLPIRARLYTFLFKPGMKIFTVRAEPWREPI